MEIVQVPEFSVEHLQMLHNVDKDTCLVKTKEFYEVRGEALYGLLGLVIPTMLSARAVVWFYLLPDVDPPLRELRQAKKDIDLVGQFKRTLYADILVEDKRAQNFARFFGLKRSHTVGDYHIYVGEQ